MIRIPEHIQFLENYKPGRPDASGNGLADERKIISLCSNENNLGPSPMALKAILDNAGNIYKYPDPTGQAVRNKLAKMLQIEAEHIILGNGSDNILYSLFNAFFEPGDELLTSEGSFVAIDPMARMNNVKVVKVPYSKEFGYDLPRFHDRINARTRGIYLCNPNNPTGTYTPAAELEAFIDRIPKDILVIVDEAYFEYASFLKTDYPDATRWPFPNVLVLRTFSKIYGLAGERIGYGIARGSVIEALWKVKPTFVPGILAQNAALAALDDQEHVSLSVKLNELMLDMYEKLFKRMGLKYLPSACNFMTVVFDSESEARHFHDHLKDNGILVRHLKGFGLSKLVRISTGTLPEYQALEQVVEGYFAKSGTYTVA